MSIKIQTESILTTLQDLGRNNFRAQGINPNGVMDRVAMRLINILLGNKETEAVLEIHFPAPKILFEHNALISIGGADFGAKVGKEHIENWQTIWIEKGQTLSFTKKHWGNRLYLSIKGGFKVDNWLFSKSTNLKANLGGFKGRKLLKNDRLEFKLENKKTKTGNNIKISRHSLPYFQSPNRIRFIEGAEFGILTPFSSENLLQQSFSISLNSDRMGYRLQGNPIYLLHEKELLSSAVSFGTIQLLPAGQLIVLMADHQTTGGYPRIGNVISNDLPKLAQLGAGETFTFELISFEKAEELILDFEKELNFLKTAIKLKS